MVRRRRGPLSVFSSTLLVIAAMGVRNAHGQGGISLTHKLSPGADLDGGPIQLTVTVEAGQVTGAGLLRVEGPQGFRISVVGETNRVAARQMPNRADRALGAIKGKSVHLFSIEANGDLRPGTYQVAAQLLPIDSSQGNPVAEDDFSITYGPRLSALLYLVIGLIGVVLGYVIRLILRVQSTVTPPTPAPPVPGAPKPGPITTFVTAHFYAVDVLVTLLIGAIVLISLLKNGAPPDGASRWHGALVIGFGLGLLTNSELISRLKGP